MFLNNQKNHRRNQKGNKNMQSNKWKWKHHNPKPTRFSKSSAKGKFYSTTSLPQETREISNKQPNFTPKATRKRRNEEPQGWYKERNHKN